MVGQYNYVKEIKYRAVICTASEIACSLFFLLLLNICSIQAQKAPTPWSWQIDSLIELGIDSMAYPGAQLMIFHEDEVLYEKAYGYHTYEKQRPVQMTDIYDLASVTKVTTAVPALMHLIDSGQVSLDQDLCELFEGLCGSNKSDLLLRQVLAHQGRLQPYIVFWQDAQRPNGKFRPRSFKSRASTKYSIRITDDLYLHRKYYRKLFRAVRKTPLNPKPGYVYSGLTFLLYPSLVKDLTGMRLDTFLQEEFFGPLNARTVGFRPTERFPLERIVPTEVDTFFRHQLVQGYVHDEAAAMLEGISTNAGLFASAPDLSKLLQVYANQGAHEGRRYFSEAIVETFTRCQYCYLNNRRGLGFDKPPIDYDPESSYVAASASPESYGHSGFTGTFFWIDPKEDMIFIFLSNRVYPDRSHRNLYQMGLRPKLHQLAYDWIREIKKGRIESSTP